jgi:hypothetical protein
MDFLPEDIDAHIRHAQMVDRAVASLAHEEVVGSLEQIQEWSVHGAEALVAAGLDPLEAISGITGAVAAELADWYKDQKDEDGEARDS